MVVAVVLPFVISALAIAGPMSTESAMPRPGLYEFEPRRLVALTEFADHRIAFTEFGTGRAGRMTRNADGLVAHHDSGDSLTVTMICRCRASGATSDAAWLTIS